MGNAVDKNGNSYNRGLMIIVILIGTFCTVLNQTVLSTAFPTIMKAFDVNTSTVQWLTTGFMLVNGIMIPVSAWLSTRFNSKWLYIGAMTVFFVGTIVCYIAPNFGTLLAGRLIQALGVGVTMPLLQTIMLSIFPPAKRGTAMGLAGIVIGLAPAIGPTLSGWVIDNWTWRDLFGMIIPLMFVVILASFWFVKSVLDNRKTSIDLLSVVLSTIGFGSLLYGFSSVGDDGWGSTTVISTLVIGVIFISLFVWRQLVMKTPFLEFRVYRSVPFTVSAILSSVTMMSMVGVEMVIPLYLQIVKGMSAFHSGLTLLAGALMMGIMSPITGRAVDRFGAKRLSILGMTLLTLGSVPFIFITKNTSTLYIVVFYAIRMFGISMSMMPATTVGMNSLPINLLSHGTAVNNTQRQVASSVGTAVLISILTNVTKSNQPAKSMLTSNPLGYRDHMINATLTGYHAAFAISLVFCVLALATAFFLKNRGQSSDYTKNGGED
ncbi:EmrB QacA subfamily drug resistance transporter [Lentilactobacillus parabuchneri DSM 5707 = NBRC 107865]|uniref:EmrB QacA subfamily drug resistance transporter n=1 Tax=Lentilactobacillus parabuchneri DSM 5707 = NBRC 107865 TaxID=1423784 RepID=A0A0R1YX05_9LACO|nr:MDR family MFS transporter [Lentilactobacillus parabuchneri]KRM47053.1 EmrB QacA subfamily drug resistance transporter [Lentilactobacillus parabuchneri DSM 5707 = NBRC 107865]MDG9737588.1 MDR family MFS transporter [Lentilactobacillus parabuchneri]